MAQLISGVLITAVAVRTLGQASFGLYATLSTGLALALVAEGAVALPATRWAARAYANEATEDRTKSREAVQRCHRVFSRVGLSGGALGLASALVATNAGAGVAWTVGLLAAAYSLQVGTASLPAIVAGRSRYDLLAGTTLVGATCGVVVVFASASTLGLPALAAGQAVSVLVQRCGIGVWLRRNHDWFSMRPGKIKAGDSAILWRAVAPALVLTAAPAVLVATDQTTVSVLCGTAASGEFRVGVILPAQLLTVIYRGYDVVFPLLAGSSAADQERVVRLSTRAVGWCAGAAFAGLVLLREPILELVTSTRTTTASAVLALTALSYAINVPAHGLALVLVARGEQRVLAPLVACEAFLNVILTVVLVTETGPTGAALATVISIALSNLLFLPRVARGHVTISGYRLVLVDGALSVAVAAAITAAVSVRAFQHVDGIAVAMTAAAMLSVVAIVPAILGREGRVFLRDALRRRA